MQRRMELDLTRATAMLAVVMIHVSSTYVYADSALSLGGINPAFALNQLSRFAVPLFVLLSGAALGLRQRAESPWRFWLSRLKKLGLPYLFWWALYQLSAVGFRPGELAGLPHPLRALLLGQGAPHLYFVPVIFQLYLLTPLLRKALARFPRLSLSVAFLLNLGASWLVDLAERGLRPIPSLPGELLWLLFPCWIFYFLFGLLAGQNLDRICAVPGRARALWPFCALAVLLAYVPCSFATGSLGSIKPALLPITLLVFLACCALWGPLSRFRPVKGVTSFLAAHSMTVYFSHVLILQVFRRLPLAGMSGMLLLFLLVLAASLLLAWAWDGALAFLKKKLSRKREAAVGSK